MFPSFPPRLRRGLPAALLAACAMGLAACGGGGADAPDAAAPRAATLAPSATLAGICTPEAEKAFARSHLDEVYLWPDEVREADPQAHGSLASYFQALLVPVRDRFSAVLSNTRADALLGADLATAQALGTFGASVPLASTVTSPGARRVGYLLFNDHRRGAQDALVDAFAALRAASIQDLVLDLRFNSGGYLYVAQAAASMVTGPANDGQVFETLRYSARRAAEVAPTVLRLGDRTTVAESRHPRGTPLPRLGLPRVYVLASGQTCSASESIVNGLRGVGVEVVLVGDTTCGKPYGFHRRDNCGSSYFAIEFQGENARGFGDYAGGFAPTCPVADDANAPLGDPGERLLSAALAHIDTGACPAQSPALRPKSLRAFERPTGLEGRLLAQPQ